MYSKSNINRSHQVTIVGGGPAGLYCALLLNKAGFDVQIIEAGSYDSYRPGEHLQPEAREMLKDLGVPDDILLDNAKPCWEIKSSWGCSKIETRDSIFHPLGEAYLLSRPAFDKALATFVEKMGIPIYCNTQYAGSGRKGKRWHIALNSKYEGRRNTRSDFIVDASGRRAVVAKSLAVGKVSYDKLVGVTAFSESNTKGNHILLEPVSMGWWYSASLPEGVVASLMTDADLIKGGSDLKDIWRKALAEAPNTTARLAKGFVPCKSYICSARSQTLNKISGTGWLAIGDAASSFDPLSAQGIYKGFMDAQRAVTTLVASSNGDTFALDRYEMEVKNHFNSYLKLRRRYYSLEQRWKNSVFWSKRQERTWVDIPVTLHPSHQFNGLYKTNKERSTYLQKIVPSINHWLLLNEINAGGTVDQIATRYRAKMPHSSDREILIALQVVE